MENSNHGWMCAVQRSNDAAFGATVIAKRGHFDQNLIAVHRRIYGVRRNENVACDSRFQTCDCCRIGSHEAEAITVQAELACDHIFPGGGLRNCITVGIDRNQLAAGHEFLQASGQFSPFVAVQAEFADELFVAGHLLWLALDFF